MPDPGADWFRDLLQVKGRFESAEYGKHQEGFDRFVGHLTVSINPGKVMYEPNGSSRVFRVLS